MQDNPYKFPTILKLYKYELERIAKQGGLTFGDVVYEMVSAEEMGDITARHGFTVMPSHWSLGQDSIMNKQRFSHGMGRTFEIVVNTIPVYAFLMDSNHLYDQKAVIAHVCGHADVFRNSRYADFSNPDMDQSFAADSVMIERFCAEYGSEAVKKWYDYVLSLENLIDPESIYFKRPDMTMSPEEREEARQKRLRVHKIESREDLPWYMEDFLNPPEWIAEQRKRFDEEEAREREMEKGVKTPPKPMRDVLFFLAHEAPLEAWQRSVLEMVRRHKYYFSQFRTKYIHEGWASLWEERIMFGLGSTQDKDMYRWTSTLASVQRQHGLNPYRLGYDLLKYMEYRWNTGRHGDIWDKVNDFEVQNRWDEFVVFHNFRLQSGGDETNLAHLWRGFSEFVQQLKSGNLGYPSELFVGDLFTSDLLLVTWIALDSCERELLGFRELLHRMQELGLEEKAAAEILKLREEVEDDAITDAELMFKARKDVYAAAGERQLYLWTEPELRLKINALEKLVEFKKVLNRGEFTARVLDIPESWRIYSSRFSSPILLGLGRRKIFEIRRNYDDYSFFDEAFDKDFCEKQKYFLAKAKKVWTNWGEDPEDHYVIESRSFERIKRRLLFMFTNMGQPIVTVEDGNYNQKGELYLKHHHSGVDLDWWSKDGMFVKDVLERLFHIWGGQKAVYLETIKTLKEEERPWWFYWHGTEEKTTSDEPETLRGRIVLFKYDKEGLAEVIGQPVEFPAPF